MTDPYESHARFYVSVDCIIFSIADGRLRVLLTRRDFEPERGKWSLMGGFVRDGESVDAAADRVLRELTGLRGTYMRQVHTFGDIGRDPGARVISVAYYALLTPGLVDDESLRAHAAAWHDVHHLPELGFDHPEMIAGARRQLYRRVSTEPVAFKLLPELFTLSNLQTIYELILDEPLDKRNFRKRVALNACIEPTEQIDKLSRRGARLYRFNAGLYEQTRKFKI